MTESATQHALAFLESASSPEAVAALRRGDLDDALVEGTRQSIAVAASARLLWGLMQSDDVAAEEWQATWDDLLTDDETENVERLLLLAAELAERLATEMERSYGPAEAIEAAVVHLRRSLPAAWSVRSALGQSASPAIRAAAPLDETVT
jgi:hypothetical protein